MSDLTSILDKWCRLFETPINSERFNLATEKCKDSSPLSSLTTSPYPDSYSYCGINANTMYYKGGDSEWSDMVRGCLVCMNENGASSHESHLFCYDIATAKSDSFFDVALGYGKALFTGATEYIKSGFNFIRDSFLKLW